MWKQVCLLVLCLLPSGYFQAVKSFTGRQLNPNCPPLEPRIQNQIQGLRQCQWIISMDQNGCRQIAQDCSSPTRCNVTGDVFWQCSQECEPTCDNLNPICRNVCGAPTCQCAPGSVRVADGGCVPKEQCIQKHESSPQCQFGEVLVRQNCSAQIREQTCDEQVQCNQLMCLCVQGTFRDTNTGQCVSRNQCSGNNPPTNQCLRDDQCHGNSSICVNGRCTQGCSTNNQCSNGLQCRFGRCAIPTCDQDFQCTQRGTICIANRCIEGCRDFDDCQQGFVCVQNQCRRVISNPGQCRSDNQCERNEICLNSRCQTGCRHNSHCANGFQCFNFECVPGQSPQCFNDRQCGPFGQCMKGRCFRDGQNPDLRCGFGEEFTNCGSACEPTCFQKLNQTCTLQCIPKCQCRQGLVRDRFERCVPRQFC